MSKEPGNEWRIIIGLLILGIVVAGVLAALAMTWGG